MAVAGGGSTILGDMCSLAFRSGSCGRQRSTKILMLKAHKMWEANGKCVQAGNPLTAQAAASRSGSRGPGTKNASLSSFGLCMAPHFYFVGRATNL